MGKTKKQANVKNKAITYKQLGEDLSSILNKLAREDGFFD